MSARKSNHLTTGTASINENALNPSAALDGLGADAIRG